MKTLFLLMAVLIGSCLTGLAADATAKNPKGKLFHVVAFKFKASATKDQIKEVETAFRNLPKKVPEIKSFKWGTNISPEKRDKGFTHGFILGFNSEKDRDTYSEHPEHKAFGKLVGPVVDDIFVIDFWNQK